MRLSWHPRINAFRIVAVLTVAITLQLLAATASAAPQDVAVAPPQIAADRAAHAQESDPAGVQQRTSTQIISHHTNRCIAAHTGPNTMAFQFSCNTAYRDQLWSWGYAVGSQQIVNVASGLCLAAHNYNGAIPFQTTCNKAYRDQDWTKDQNRIKNLHSGLCLAIHGMGDGARPFMHPCANYKDQDWTAYSNG